MFLLLLSADDGGSNKFVMAREIMSLFCGVDVCIEQYPARALHITTEKYRMCERNVTIIRWKEGF